MKILELFAGSRSIGRNAEKLGHKVFSVDWVRYEGINLAKDIEALRKKDIPFTPDMIWASPDCKTYSILAVRHHRDGILPKTEYARKCDAVNKHFISLIKSYLKLNPKMVFFIENPRGMMRKMPFVKGFTRHTVWYCQYGHTCAKPTDIWTNCLTWTPRPPCHNGNTKCHHLRVPRGTSGGIQGMSNSYERSKVPNDLCIEVINAAAQKIKSRKFQVGDSGTNAPMLRIAA